MSKEPKEFTTEDYENYARLMVKTNTLYRDNNPEKNTQKAVKVINGLKYLKKWNNRRQYEGKGVVVIPGDPNALLERLDLLLTSQEAGHTGVANELVSICDELKRQGVLDPKSFKKYGGSGIFDTIANFLTRSLTSSAARQIASSALDVGKSVAKEGAKKALEVGKSAAVDAGKKLVAKALTPKSKKYLQKYMELATQDINTLID